MTEGENEPKRELPSYLPELARLEYACHQAREKGRRAIPAQVEQFTVNPTLMLLQLGWRNLPALLNDRRGKPEPRPQQGEELVLIYYPSAGSEMVVEQARSADLLAMKLVVEEISAEEAAREGRVVIGVIDQLVAQAVRRGILLAPPSAIRRNPHTFPRGENIPEHFFVSPVFTLQWHLTQACDLHCRHCYDRSDRANLPLDRGLAILDDLRGFCHAHYVQGQVSFSGGNPLLYPHFFELYQAAVDRNLTVAVLGNPASPATMERMLAIQRPAFYQVSLEGLAEHNDYIRGPGHFERVMQFLGLLKKLGVYSMVMLTLTRDNQDEVLPLADLLRDRADLFTFNRLAMVGEGAALAPADRQGYADFLRSYLQAAETNPVISLKDNLLNLLRWQEEAPLFGGCAGHGCGAAFNFITILPDGEAHACRKLPSPIGNAFTQSITEIYHNEPARRFRAGTTACAACPIRPVCGGCLAVVHGFGLDIFNDRDPYCFMAYA